MRRGHLPAGWSWPLRVDELLDLVGVDRADVDITWHRGDPFGDALEVSWQSPRPAWWGGENAVAVWVYAVPDELFEAVAPRLREAAAAAGAWIAAAWARDEEWKARRHARRWTWDGRRLRAQDHTGGAEA